jgi:hypothetical protein
VTHSWQASARAFLFQCVASFVLHACEANETRSEPDAAPLASAASTSAELDELSRRTRYLLFTAHERSRGTRYALPGETLPERCPADSTADKVSPLISVVDVRADARELMSIELTRRLMGEALDDWKRRHGASGESPPRYRSLEQARRAVAELGEVLERPYRLVLHVTDYAEPRLILKPGEARRRWVSGALSARLVLYEEERGTGWCETKMSVRNDTADIPISLRRKPDVQARLTAELGREMRVRAWAWLGRENGAQ